ncbi:MAG: hypothetical protein AB1696_03315 [Planctomycetota bacterium]
MRRILLGLAMLVILLFSRVARPENEAEFITGLAARESVTYAEGVRGVAFAITGEGTILPFEEALSALRQKEIVDKKWDLKNDDRLTNGKFAVMLFKAAGLKKGLGDALFGLSEKTAIKECGENDLMGGGRPGDPVSGMSLVLSLQGLATRLRARSGTQEDLVKIDLNAAKPETPDETKAAQERLIVALTAGLKQASTEISGTVAATRGAMWIQPKDSAWAPAKEGDAAAVGTRLFAGINGQAQITFPDGTIFLVQPFTVVEIVSAGKGESTGGAFYVVKVASSFGAVRVQVGEKGFLSIIQVGSPTSYATALEGAFEQRAAGSLAETEYDGSKGRISVVQGSW